MLLQLLFNEAIQYVEQNKLDYMGLRDTKETIDMTLVQMH